MISLKWIKSLANFYWRETNLCQYWICGPFPKHSERNKKFRETGNLKYLFRNELDKACFARDATSSISKDLSKRTISNKILKDRAYEIARNCKCDGYHRALASKYVL